MAIGLLLMGLFAVVNPHIRTTVPDLRALMRQVLKELRREPRAKSFVPEVHNLHDSHAIVLEASPAGGIH